jgi:hypothetical protein
MFSILRDGYGNLTVNTIPTHLTLELCPDEEKQPFLQSSISSTNPQRNAHPFENPPIQLNLTYQTLLFIATSPIGYP